VISISLSPVVEVLVVTEVGFALEKKDIVLEKAGQPAAASQSWSQTSTAPKDLFRELNIHNSHTLSIISFLS